MKKSKREAVLAHFRVHKSGSIESVALALKIKACTAYANIRLLVRSGDLKPGPAVVVHDGRGRAYNCLTWSLVERQVSQAPMTLVQRALASRDPITLAWWGSAC